ncbi:MAG: Asp-tRNA(Asn)/Glu-tRNA(Gln) amidotransferase GatCAB subunit B, partial [Planctomycetes bacterium]|nr:Asp-tRNA(Asn)/Glu-tRNA(Gln) amidotransferase GatCAB subunit B [Planctomycetota bacterium]
HKTTRGWDEQAQVTRPQRQKEESSDYRYFPDPDLMPVVVSDEQLEAVRAALGELPADTRRRLVTEFGIDAYDADVIVNQGRALVDYFIEVAEASGDAKRASNWVQQDVLRTLNERGISIAEFPVPAASLVELLALVQQGELETSRGRDVFNAMAQSGISVAQAMKALGIERVDRSELVDLCRRLLAENPSVVADVQGGKEKAIGALIGQAKRQNPNANPNEVRQICLELIRAM